MADDPTPTTGNELRWEDLDPDVAAAISTPVLSDSLDVCGHRHQVMRVGISATTSARRAVGRAHTAAFAPDDRDHDDPYHDAMTFIDGIRPGQLAVVATGGDDRSAFWGELFSAAALGHGSVGTVTDGPVRDTAKVEQLGYPLFAPGARPIDFRARMAVVSLGERVNCGGVDVSPGDLVMADGDGVVVVPQAIESDVLNRALARVTAESTVLAELLGGASLREVWDRWKVL